MSKELELVAAKIPPSLYEKIEEAIDSSNFMNTSDFLRQAIREKLGENGSNLATIAISKSTHNRLLEIGEKGDSFDDTIRKFIDEKGG